eukprot:CAMPEP_0174348828 /NCGR_PEP_ID=MMETSP0811_2-20130205/5429_1 /TAXON_ID=73025 ORGANISM="Eutreptiella gymnastica-like, Strain CCMP1594" /NCGR_SAMPLE_ID=MMETSP0811_2 /ASSEMBLY_ACC=CAM_ASM_000667 /LENGTH=241 /DNA_ID=CAMNT_0015475733 /DNA_START=158 /DNA_END=882 /DNA_ORIENTATION=-
MGGTLCVSHQEGPSGIWACDPSGALQGGSRERPPSLPTEQEAPALQPQVCTVVTRPPGVAVCNDAVAPRCAHAVCHGVVHGREILPVFDLGTSQTTLGTTCLVKCNASPTGGGGEERVRPEEVAGHIQLPAPLLPTTPIGQHLTQRIGLKPLEGRGRANPPPPLARLKTQNLTEPSSDYAIRLGPINDVDGGRQPQAAGWPAATVDYSTVAQAWTGRPGTPGGSRRQVHSKMLLVALQPPW